MATAETSREPRQPRRLLKKRNTRASYPPGDAYTPAARGRRACTPAVGDPLIYAWFVDDSSCHTGGDL